MMNQYNGKLLELPKKGKTLVITDIHGNLADFNKIMNIWANFQYKNNHIIITGDFIHAMGRENDKSIEIMDSLKYHLENTKNFHILLGNHEWSVISKTTIYKGGKNLNLNFEIILKEVFGDKWKIKLDEYIEFFKKLPLAVRTQNNVFISHAGPPKNVESIKDIIQITNKGYLNNVILFELLWNREGDYTKEDINYFLKKVGCNALIVGHSPVNGYKLIEKKQLIISSSYSRGKKAYVELDLEKKINNGKDLVKMVKYFN